MRIDFRQKLLDIDGQPMKKGDKDFLLVHACQEALCATFHGEENMAGADKVRRFALALKISDPVPPDLTIEEVAEIRLLVGKAYGPPVVGRAWPMLDVQTAEVSQK